ncbi:MAG: hypothetical protein ABW101_09960 [Candidatus Thiodiazotropha sp.]
MNSSLYKVILMGTLLVHVGSLWAADIPENPVEEEPPSETSDNMQSWQEDWQRDEDRRGDWTWFGMGYESRHQATQNRGSNSAGGGASQGPGGGNGPGGGGNGPGGRNR